MKCWQPSEFKVDEVADIIRNMALPFLAEAVEKEAKEAKARAEFRRVKEFAERMKRKGFKVEVTSEASSATA